MNDNHNKLERISPAGLNPWESPNADSAMYGKQARMKLLREWRRIIFRHKWLIAAIIVAALPFTAIQAYREKSLYQATTTIEVRPETSSLSKTGEVLFVESTDNTRAELFILNSQPVLKKTISSLKLDRNPRFLDVVKKRSMMEALAAIKGGESSRDGKQAQTSGGDKSQGANHNAAVASSGAHDSDDGPSDSSTILPDSLAERDRLEPYLAALNSNLKVDGMPQTRLIKIAFTHTDPAIAATVANGVASSFISHSFQTKTERFSNTSGWLEESTRKLKTQVEQAEQRLANYSRENNIFSMEGKESLTAERLTRLHDQVMRTETDRLLKQSLYEEVKQGRVAQLPEAFSDPTAELRKELNDMAVLASQLSVKHGAKHPKLLELKEQMSTIEQQISANSSMLEEKLKADFDRSVRDEASLKSALGRAKEEAVQQNQATIQFSVLQQDLTTAKALYTDFLNKTSQANIQRAEQYNNVRLIEAAEAPSAPIGPKRGRILFLGFIISLMLGVGLSYIIENLNTSIRNVEDLTRCTQLPTLAVIPTLTGVMDGKKRIGRLNGQPSLKAAGLKDIEDSIELIKSSTNKAALTDTLKKFSAAAESYRMLRTSVLLSTAGHPPRTILITSGQPGDGKTTTVFNTAIALTQLKANVVIVDCDMRKPRVHKLAQLSKGEGLSTYLTSGGDLGKLISPTPVPHLSILPCGYIPPNPSELISSEKMKQLLVELSERFDYVVIDSPPLITVTDPIILSTLVDGVILVVKSGRSKIELIRHACLELSGVRAKVLGVVLNDFNLRQDGYEPYFQYRYYADYSDKGKSGKLNGASA
jgi:succinoglycan biosynthesis transport protein ExoP